MDNNNNTAIYGIYQSPASAERAVEVLVGAGFTNNDISVLMPDQDSRREFAHENSTKAPEGAATGAATGGAVGGTLGLLAGIGALAIPGIGPFIAARVRSSARWPASVPVVRSAVWSGASSGWASRSTEAKRYEGSVKDGGVLLSVHAATSGQASRAKAILKNTGAEDISSSGEANAEVPATAGRGASRF